MSQEPDSAEILQRCLQAIARGKATVEQCVAHYPQVLSLRDMLYAAQMARALPRTTMSNSRKRALETQLVTLLGQRKRTAARRSYSWVSVATAAAAIVLLLLLSSFGLSRASASALPGDVLYGVKRSSEQVRLWYASTFANVQLRPSVLADIADARLSELDSLMQRGQPIETSLFNDAKTSLNAAVNAPLSASRRSALYANSAAMLHNLVMRKISPEQATVFASALEAIATSTPILKPADAVNDSAQTTATEVLQDTSDTSTPLAPDSSATDPAPSGQGLTASATVEVSPTTLRTLLASCVSNPSIYNSMLTKINAGQFDAFINQVEAQTGKNIDVKCASGLIDIADALRSSLTATQKSMGNGNGNGNGGGNGNAYGKTAIPSGNGNGNSSGGGGRKP